MKKQISLLWKLFLSHIIIVVVSLSTILLFTVISLRDFNAERTSQELRTRAELFKEMLPENINQESSNTINALADSIAAMVNTRLTIVLSNGTVIADSDENWRIMENHGDRPELIDAFNGDIGVSTRYSSTLNDVRMYVAIPIQRDGRVVAAVRASMPVTRVSATLHGLIVNILLITIIIGIFIAVISYIISSKISAPIRQMSILAKKYAQGDFSQRMPITSTTEIAELAESLTESAVDIDKLIRDVNDRRNKLEAILSGMSEAIFSVDNDGRIVEMNRAAELLINRTKDSVEGKRMQEIIRDIHLQRFIEATLDGSGLSEQEIIIHAESERVLQVHGARIVESDNTNTGAVFVLNDITGIKRLETMRRDFVTNISHELNTPITSILGFVETLRDGAIEDQVNRKPFLDITHHHVLRLKRIVEDLLSLLRIEQITERGLKDLEQIDICKLFRKISSFYTRPEGEVQIEVACEQVAYSGNRQLIEQALMNLVDNAVKYGGKSARIILSAVNHPEGLRISVSDNGPGISLEHQARVFERFYRIDSGRSRDLGGTGLGLAIVKHIALAHGGSVMLSSTVGKGSIFTITLPQQLNKKIT